MINFKKLYKDFVIGRKYLKLINFFHYEKIDPEELIIQAEEKCLILAPHFDDETFGCGGLLIRYPQNVHVVCLTNSKFGTVEDNNEELIDIRKKEFISVMEQVGISSYEFFDIQDGKLIFNYEKFKQLEIFDYDYIFIPNYFENHKDHKAVTNLLQQLLKEKKYKKSLKIAMYEIWSAMTLPNCFLDITPFIKNKTDLINLYASQTKNLWFSEGIIALNAYRGMLVNRGSVEMYTILDKKTFKKL
jgi:LmbE family N-acetylglucosaminyl deacetylase